MKNKRAYLYVSHKHWILCFIKISYWKHRKLCWVRCCIWVLGYVQTPFRVWEKWPPRACIATQTPRRVSRNHQCRALLQIKAHAMLSPITLEQEGPFLCTGEDPIYYIGSALYTGFIIGYCFSMTLGYCSLASLTCGFSVVSWLFIRCSWVSMMGGAPQGTCFGVTPFPQPYFFLLEQSPIHVPTFLTDFEAFSVLSIQLLSPFLGESRQEKWPRF